MKCGPSARSWTAGISLAVPEPRGQLTERLADVLAVVYVMFNEGFVSSTGPTQDRNLAADAVWLAEVGRRPASRRRPTRGGWPPCCPSSTPGQPRASTRPETWSCCPDQDRFPLGPRRDRRRASALIERAARPAAARSATSCRPRSPPCTPTAPSWEETDWLQIVLALRRPWGRGLDPSPVVRAEPGRGPGPARAHRREALAQLDALADALASYHPLPRHPGRAAHQPSAATTRPARRTARAWELTEQPCRAPLPAHHPVRTGGRSATGHSGTGGDGS